MADIFNRNVVYGDAFKAEEVYITFSGIQTGMLVQNMNIAYNQTITRIWEVGSEKTYFIAGRTAGTFAVGKLAGPAGGTKAFVTRYGDACNIQNNVLNFAYGGGWCSGDTGASPGFTLNYCVIQNIGIQVAAADMIVNENVQGMYSLME